MHTLFIADLHLCSDEPAITAGFLRFLQQQARNAEALYILGDLFEVWIGDDEQSQLQQQVSEALLQLNKQGVPCYFIHGNRDFLLGQRFANRCQMTLLAEKTVLELYGQRLLILHGDLFCTDDMAYQRFRRYMHNRLLQTLFLHCPLGWRQCLAERLRNRSQNSNQYKSERIMDVNPNAVEQALTQYQVQGIIHGHTHRPAIHYLNPPAPTPFRAVLGAWHQQGSTLRVTPQGIELLFFPFSGVTNN